MQASRLRLAITPRDRRRYRPALLRWRRSCAPPIERNEIPQARRLPDRTRDRATAASFLLPFRREPLEAPLPAPASRPPPSLNSPPPPTTYPPTPPPYSRHPPPLR